LCTKHETQNSLLIVYYFTNSFFFGFCILFENPTVLTDWNSSCAISCRSYSLGTRVHVANMRVLTRRDRVHSGRAVTLRLNLTVSNPIWSGYLGHILDRRQIIRGRASSRWGTSSLWVAPLDDKSVRSYRFTCMWQTICVSVRGMTRHFEEKNDERSDCNISNTLERCTSWI